jgi:hypothetical protein
MAQEHDEMLVSIRQQIATLQTMRGFIRQLNHGIIEVAGEKQPMSDELAATLEAKVKSHKAAIRVLYDAMPDLAEKKVK